METYEPEFLRNRSRGDARRRGGDRLHSIGNCESDKQNRYCL